MNTQAQQTYSSQPTIHYPRPAIVAQGTEHTWQRRFGDASTAGGLRIQPRTDQAEHPIATVMRDAKRDVAELELEIGLYTCASITVRLTPAELRELAARLIDAAHDIEAHPARTLLQQHWGASTPAGQEVSA